MLSRMTPYDEKALRRIKSKTKTNHNGCHIWQGAGKDQSPRVSRRRKTDDGDGYATHNYDTPKVWYNGRNHDPQNVVWGIINDHEPQDVTVRATCIGGALCCNIEHLLGKARTVPRSIITCSQAEAIYAQRLQFQRPLTQQEIDGLLNGEELRTSFTYEEMEPWLLSLGIDETVTFEMILGWAEADGTHLVPTQEHFEEYRRKHP